MKRIAINLFGLVVLIYAFLFAIATSEHFGNNSLPQSREELVCDITSLILVISGSIIFNSGKDKK